MTDTVERKTLTREHLLDVYRTMRTIREFEERVHAEFATGEIPGFVHLYAGEEASAVGVCSNLDDRDTIVSDKGGMFVTLEGEGKDGASLRIEWNLIAERNDGPHIPCGAAIALARKFGSGASLPRGAMPCLGLLTVEEFLEPVRDLSISEKVT